MTRRTVSLPEDLSELLQLEARRRGLSISEVVREALVKALHFAPAERRKLPFAALGRSGHSNTATDFEAILEQEWAPVRDR